jgi:hypothetical protein
MPGRVACGAVSSSLGTEIESLTSAMRRNDSASFRRGCGEILAAARGLGGDELTAVVAELAAVLDGLHGEWAATAMLAGACVEFGGSPLALAPVLPENCRRSLVGAATCRKLWQQGGWRGELPDRADLDALPAVLARFRRRYALPAGHAELLTAVAMSWFDVEFWLPAMLTAMQRREFRAAAGLRTDIERAAAELAEVLPDADLLVGLCRVLDDESLIVVDDRRRRAVALTMSGIGDNCQLHTLLADRLFGGAEPLLTGEPPAPAWVAAAVGGEPDPGADGPIARRLRLFDGTGRYVYPEGVPADITPVGGQRILVVRPPLGTMAWANGRRYEAMSPALAVDRVLGPEETAEVLRAVAAPRETDFMATGRP